MPRSPLGRLQKLCLALPEAHEVKAWGEPTCRVKNTMFAMYANANNHHGAGRHAVWGKAAPGRQERAVRTAPARLFVPPYMGPSGRIGVWLERECEWDEHANLLPEAARHARPEAL